MSDSDSPISNEFTELLAGFIDDQLTQEESKRLAELIQSDPAARKLYLEHCQMHANLRWEHGVLGEIDLPEDEEEETTIVEFPVWKRWQRPLTIAASVLMLASIAWITIAPKVRTGLWNSGEAVGSIVRKSGGQLKVDKLNLNLEQGDTLRPGTYTFSEGLTQFILTNEVEVLVEAPAHFRIESPLLMELIQGRLSANVPPQGHGFTVKTPNAEVVDFGTEFGVEVGSDNQSEVHVFEGEVEVKTEEWSEEPVRLYGDQATRVATNAGQPIGIPAEPERFLTSFEEPTLFYSQLVRELKPAVYYRMSISDDGATLLDRSANKLHGRIDRGEMKNPVFARGRVGASLRLEGPGKRAYAMVDDYPKATEDKLSFAAWVYAESRPRWASIAKNWSPNVIGQFHLGLYFDTGELEVQIREADGETVYVKDSDEFPTNSWQHVAFVVDGEFARLYRNGKEVANGPCSSIATPNYPFLGIGAKLHDGKVDLEKQTTGFWDGKIDELSIFNHALAPEKIEQLYKAPRGGKQARLQ